MKFFIANNFIFRNSQEGPSSKTDQSKNTAEIKPGSATEKLQQQKRSPKLARAKEMFLKTMTPKQAEHIVLNYKTMLAKMEKETATGLLRSALSVYTETTKIKDGPSLQHIFQAMKDYEIWKDHKPTREIIINILKQPVASGIIAKGSYEPKNGGPTIYFSEQVPDRLWSQIQNKAKQIATRRPQK